MQSGIQIDYSFIYLRHKQERSRRYIHTKACEFKGRLVVAVAIEVAIAGPIVKGRFYVSELPKGMSE